MALTLHLYLETMSRSNYLAIRTCDPLRRFLARSFSRFFSADICPQFDEFQPSGHTLEPRRDTCCTTFRRNKASRLPCSHARRGTAASHATLQRPRSAIVQRNKTIQSGEGCV
jgi:hypothetical protein